MFKNKIKSQNISYSRSRAIKIKDEGMPYWMSAMYYMYKDVKFNFDNVSEIYLSSWANSYEKETIIRHIIVYGNSPKWAKNFIKKCEEVDNIIEIIKNKIGSRSIYGFMLKNIKILIMQSFEIFE